MFRHSVRDLGEGLRYETYKHKVYDVVVTYLDDTISSITTRGHLYLLPDIIIDKEKNIYLDAKDIFIPLEKRNALEEKYKICITFIEDELIPLLKTL